MPLKFGGAGAGDQEKVTGELTVVFNGAISTGGVFGQATLVVKERQAVLFVAQPGLVASMRQRYNFPGSNPPYGIEVPVVVPKSVEQSEASR
jgi:hypothetical protein